MELNTAGVYQMSRFSVFDNKHFLDEGNTVNVVSLGFRNAFDRGPHG